jgi:glutamate synthase (NADPH/NADH)
MGLAVEATHGKYTEPEEQIEEEYTPYQPAKGLGYGWAEALPEKQGLYDPSLEKDACGVGFAA